MKIFLPIIQFVVSLFLATQVWAWLRMLGSLWVSDSFYLIDVLLHSVSIFHFGITSFLISLVPVSIAFVSGRMTQSLSMEFFGYIVFGVAMAIVYVMYTYGLWLQGNPYLLMHGPVIISAGALAAIIFFGVTRLPIWETADIRDNASVNKSRRYLISGVAAGVGGAGLLSALVGPARIWWKSDRFIDIDLSKMEEGQHLVVEINQKPVWIIKRTEDMLDSLSDDNIELYDPDSRLSLQPNSAQNTSRSIKPEYLVIYPICTHLGCIVSYRPDGIPGWDSGQFANTPGFFCPCHGGVFDIAGRVVKGTPPPENLKVPDYEFVSEDVVRIHYPLLSEVWSEA